jgi:hypothetical protein
MSQYTKALSRQREVLELEEMMNRETKAATEDEMTTNPEQRAGDPRTWKFCGECGLRIGVYRGQVYWCNCVKDANDFREHAPSERELLQHALDWNEEYKSLNNLVGNPYWVNWAKESLGMVGHYTKPKRGESREPAPPMHYDYCNIPSHQGGREQATPQVTRFADFNDDDHPFRIWWQKHGQFMLSGGGVRESIWTARGWIAREQMACGVEVTGDSLHERGQASVPSPTATAETEKK